MVEKVSGRTPRGWMGGRFSITVHPEGILCRLLGHLASSGSPIQLSLRYLALRGRQDTPLETKPVGLTSSLLGVFLQRGQKKLFRKEAQPALDHKLSCLIGKTIEMTQT